MIERFYDPVRNADGSLGQVTFDGQDLKSVKLKSLREAIGYVPQEPTLIIGTIRENLLFGNRDATEEQLNRALNKANAQFVFELDRKLDTFIGTSSVVNLSGGQKQRLAIARALLKDPKILILDEATSALDPQSEKEVQNAIERIEMQGSNGDPSSSHLTILVIAHRLTSIKNAKNILFIEGRDQISPYRQGTAEYEDALMRLKNFTYAFKDFDEEELEEERLLSVHENSVANSASPQDPLGWEEDLKAPVGEQNFDEIVQEGRDAARTLPATGRKEELGVSINDKADARRESKGGQYDEAPRGNGSLVSPGLELALSASEMSEGAPGYRAIGAAAIMSHYTPKWMAVVGLIASAGASV
jgi:ABC-type iron transport system FetAB ATPase subunit